MSGSLDFGFADMYPTFGGLSTRTQTVPEAEDQNTLVDDEDLAYENPVGVTHASHKSVWVSIAIVIGVMVLLSWKF